MKTEILKVLRVADDFVSGQELCDKLGVSRTAIWKVVNQLKEDGYEIEAVRNRGYRLMEIPDVVSEAEIKSRLMTIWASQQLHYFFQVDSTNTKAKSLAEEGAPHGTLVVAETQTLGKGRRGKGWMSSIGTGIWMTLVLRPKISPASASMLTLIAALAVSDGIEQVTQLAVLIKWPNDIVIDGHKLCGILTEMSTEIDYINYVVVGMGINVNNQTFPDEIALVATSLYKQTGKVLNRSQLIASIMKSFEYYYDIFTKTEDLSGVQEDYCKKLANINRQVRVNSLLEEYTGISLGINKNGELLVKLDNGEVKQVISGEVSVRGIYGYTD